MSDHIFINPYTFVPFPKNGAVRSDLTDLAKRGKPVISGEIKCTLIAKTQLAVPDILKNPYASDDEVKEYDFFGINIDGKRMAAIPGSGIRGVIRSVYETLTDSCVHLNDTDDDYFHTRVNKTDPGIIEFKDGKYILYQAERFRDKIGGKNAKTNKPYSTGEVVKFFPKAGMGRASGLVKSFFPDKTEKGEPKSGVYLRVNTFGSKGKENHPSVLVKGKVIEKDFNKIYIARLKKNVEMYEGNYKDKYKRAIENMEKNGKELPVWYWKDGDTGHYYLAPSQYSRAVFVNQPKDLVKRAKVNSCFSSKNVCAACALFGFIGDEDSRASHVRFTDAVCRNDRCFDRRYILPILSTPRLSSFEFYLDGKGKNKFGPDSTGVTLAGRKYYWHAPDTNITCDDTFAKNHLNMASKMELAKKGSKFEFSVFFDRITDHQLKELVFALNLGENNESSLLCHKIGHGKPIGLGSVKIIVDNVSQRSYEQGVYSVEDITDDVLSEAKSTLFHQTPELDAFLQKVLNFNFTKGKAVDYPRKELNGEIFKWFAGNRGSLRSEGYIEIGQYLPKITDRSNKDQTLRGELPDSGKNNGYNNRKHPNDRNKYRRQF